MKRNSTVSLYIFLLIFSTAPFFGNKLIAQEKGIYELTNNDTFKKSKKVKGNSNNDRESFYDLAFKMHPTHYFKDSALKSVYNSGDPVKLTFEDTKSFNLLKNTNTKQNEVELITVLLNNSSDLNDSIDLSENVELKKLKYVFVKCNFNCSADQIKKFVKTNSDIRIFYSSQDPS
tara:strand:+ start:12654 stop:13178 length:525 start_codon:yes stop_codon:yes gene_type:complete